MTRPQRVALLGAPAVVAFMLGVYAFLSRALPRERAWLTGFLVYWPICCLGIPLVTLGPKGLAGMFRRSRWDWPAALAALLPIGVTVAGRLVPHGESRSSLGAPLLVLITIAMAFFEEILWRGTYHELFPGDRRWSVLWPSVWFALWHFAPGMVSTLAAPTLAGGALLLGLLLAWITDRTGSIRWGVLTHAVAGLVRML